MSALTGAWILLAAGIILSLYLVFSRDNNSETVFFSNYGELDHCNPGVPFHFKDRYRRNVSAQRLPVLHEESESAEISFEPIQNDAVFYKQSLGICRSEASIRLQERV